MAITQFRERKVSQNSTGEPPTVEYHYNAYPSNDFYEVQSTAYGLTANSVISPYGILYRQDIKAEEEHPNHWHVTVVYGKKKNENGSFSLSFDTTGGTVEQRVALSSVSSYKAPGEDDPADFGGAIDVQEDGEVKGVSVVIPALKVTVNFKHPLGVITQDQIRFMARATGCVNSTSFLGYDAGEALFLGATGSEGTDAETEVSYQFACSENVTGLTFGEITGIAKDGWDVIWVRFKDTVDGGNAVRKPKWLYVERVYRRKNLASILGFG